MSDEREMPERVWLADAPAIPGGGWVACAEWPEVKFALREYVRADLHAAQTAELEDLKRRLAEAEERAAELIEAGNALADSHVAETGHGSESPLSTCTLLAPWRALSPEPAPEKEKP